MRSVAHDVRVEIVVCGLRIVMRKERSRWRSRELRVEELRVAWR